MDEDTYAGEDADTFRLMFSKHLEVYFVKTAERAKQVALKLFFAHNTGKYCKKKCYDFIGAFGGGEGTRDTESFGGKLYCDLDMIVMLKGEANAAAAYGENIRNLAAKAEGLLQQLQIVSFNTGEYVSRINACCTKINQLEDYSVRLTEYAELAETMDDNLQKGLRECIPEYYEMTADGVDDRQAYLAMTFELDEIVTLLCKPKEELTNIEKDKLAVILITIEKVGILEEVYQRIDELFELGKLSDEQVSYINGLLPKVEQETHDQNNLLANAQQSPIYQALLDSEYASKALALTVAYEETVSLYGEAFAIGLMANIWEEGNWGLIEGNWGHEYWNAVSPEVRALAFTVISDEETVDILINGIPKGTEGIGIGVMQWSGIRREGLLEKYKELAGSYTTEECSAIEVTYMLDELSGNGQYNAQNYSKIIEMCQDFSASECACCICLEYLSPKDKDKKSEEREAVAENLEMLISDMK